MFIYIYDKRDDFNFPIVNFPFICSNIPAAHVYGVYISQLIQQSASRHIAPLGHIILIPSQPVFVLFP
jgi:hypothetical protein